MNRLLIFCAIASLAAHGAFGIAASQAWVSNYVAKAIAGSAGELQASAKTTEKNGVAVIEACDGSSTVRIEIPDSTDAALRATNCTATAVSASVTNGTLFVWNGAGAYVSPAGNVTATATNLLWRGVGSVPSGGLERFAGWFDVKGVRIQPSTSFAITNAIQEVAQ